MTTRTDILRNIIKFSPVAKSLIVWLDGREKNSRETKVRIAAARTEQDYYALVAFFKLLDSLGFGTFVKGTHGHESRFVWKYPTKVIARRVLA